MESQSWVVVAQTVLQNLGRGVLVHHQTIFLWSWSCRSFQLRHEDTRLAVNYMLTPWTRGHKQPGRVYSDPLGSGQVSPSCLRRLRRQPLVLPTTTEVIKPSASLPSPLRFPHLITAWNLLHSQGLQRYSLRRTNVVFLFCLASPSRWRCSKVSLLRHRKPGGASSTSVQWLRPRKAGTGCFHWSNYLEMSVGSLSFPPVSQQILGGKACNLCSMPYDCPRSYGRCLSDFYALTRLHQAVELASFKGLTQRKSNTSEWSAGSWKTEQSVG